MNNSGYILFISSWLKNIIDNVYVEILQNSFSHENLKSKMEDFVEWKITKLTSKSVENKCWTLNRPSQTDHLLYELKKINRY